MLQESDWRSLLEVLALHSEHVEFVPILGSQRMSLKDVTSILHDLLKWLMNVGVCVQIRVGLHHSLQARVCIHLIDVFTDFLEHGGLLDVLRAIVKQIGRKGVCVLSRGLDKFSHGGRLLDLRNHF